jgi:hypothetical protein
MIPSPLNTRLARMLGNAKGRQRISTLSSLVAKGGQTGPWH